VGTGMQGGVTVMGDYFHARCRYLDGNDKH